MKVYTLVSKPLQSQQLRIFIAPWSAFMAAALLGCPPRLELPARSLEIGGVERTYAFYAPPATQDNPMLPLVVVLHGAGGTGNQIARTTDFHELAETEQFFVAYPDGLRRVWGFEPGDTPDDAAFIEAVIDDMAANFPVDETRIYLVGVSNGGFLTHLLSCTASDRIAAAAMVISALPVSIAENCAPLPPMPVLIMNGTEDPIVPYHAAILQAGPRTLPVLPAMETVHFWAARNGISDEPSITPLPDSVDDGTHAELRAYVNADSTAEVAAYIIYGGGHSWPGLQRDVAVRLLGRTAHDFCATEVIWDFFVRQSNDRPTP